MTSDGTLVTRYANNAILNGVTRLSILRLAQESASSSRNGPSRSRKPMPRAKRSFPAPAPSSMPVTRIDDRSVGNGKPGYLERKTAPQLSGHTPRIGVPRDFSAHYR